MSARLPYPVAQGNRRLEHAISVTSPAIRSGDARTYVESRLVPERSRPRSARPLRLGGDWSCVAWIAELPRGGLLGQRAARDHGDAHGDEVGPGRGRGRGRRGQQCVEGGRVHVAVDDAVSFFRGADVIRHGHAVGYSVIQPVEGAHVDDVVGDRGYCRLAVVDLELGRHRQAAVCNGVEVVDGQIDGRGSARGHGVKVPQIEYASHVRRAGPLIHLAYPSAWVESRVLAG